MKRYLSCFLFFLCLTGGCLIALFYLTARLDQTDPGTVQEVQMPETFEEPVLAEAKDWTRHLSAAGIPNDGRINEDGTMDGAKEKSETLAHIVLNQDHVRHESLADSGEYYLVAEEGYLIVYDHTKESVSLFTHMPLAEFPLDEQERLMEGIWFPTMAEIFSYLESYSS